MRTTPPHPAFVATLAAVTLLAGGAVSRRVIEFTLSRFGPLELGKWERD